MTSFKPPPVWATVTMSAAGASPPSGTASGGLPVVENSGNRATRVTVSGVSTIAVGEPVCPVGFV